VDTENNLINTADIFDIFNNKISYKGEWLAGSLIDVGQIQIPYWTKWLLDQEIFW
jgi:hypothetical protein